MQNEQRKTIIREKIEQGATLKEIGAEFNLSKERIRQIAKDSGIVIRELKQTKKQKLEEEKLKAANLQALEEQKRLLKVLDLHQEGKKPFEIAKELNVHRKTAYGLIKRLGIRLSAENKVERNTKIKEMFQVENKTQVEIAKHFGLTITQVANIIHARKKPYDKNKYLNYKKRLKELNNTKSERESKQ